VLGTRTAVAPGASRATRLRRRTPAGLAQAGHWPWPSCCWAGVPAAAGRSGPRPTATAAGRYWARAERPSRSLCPSFTLCSQLARRLDACVGAPAWWE
jgi:hypothetical protein